MLTGQVIRLIWVRTDVIQSEASLLLNYRQILITQKLQASMTVPLHVIIALGQRKYNGI